MLYRILGANLRRRDITSLSRRLFAVHAFKLPDIGEGIAEVQIMEWFVKEGDRVNEMDKLCLVESDKASVEITSRYSGIVKSIKAPVHEQAKVGSVILEIDDESGDQRVVEEPVQKKPYEAPPKAEPGSKAQSKETKPRGETGKGGSEIKASPAVRALAKSLGVDLSSVSGSGADGRITENDVKKYGKTETKSPEEQKESPPSKTSEGKEVKLSQVGLAMVKSMTDSLRIPQFSHSDEIECDKLLEMIKALKPMMESEFNIPTLTLTAFFIKAASLGITKMPIINSRMSASGESYHLFNSHNISIAMDSPRGLVVPNIKNVQNLSIVEIQRQLLELQKRAKSGRLSLDDIKGGTMSLSNIGVIGGTYAKPVIFDGQAVIGALGRVQLVPRYAGGDPSGPLVPKRIFNVSWTADHRHVDGATVARFSNYFRDSVENPEKVFALYFK